MKRSVLRTFCTYFLLIALTLQSFHRSLMTMDYQLRLPDYLAKCINRDQPQSHCNGSCVLMKKIKEKEEGESKQNTVTYECSAFYLHKDYTVFKMNQSNADSAPSHFKPYLIDYRFEYGSLVFRPPVG